MDTEHNPEKWKVEANGQIFETDLEEITGWISEGALLRHDRVQKGNLRWIEAGKLPVLINFFNAKELGGSPTLPTASVSTPNVQLSSNDTWQRVNADVDECCIHSGIKAHYNCGSCGSLFCRACPTSYGGTVKICPYCGALCEELSPTDAPVHRAKSHSSPIRAPFGFGDLAEAFTYPFRFKTSLVLGTIMFVFFSIGRSVLGFGGIFMISSAIMCWMLANTLTFGILSNTVENMAAGRTGLNFMPTFEDFSVWDDVIQPFFLMIGVNFASFAPLAGVVIIAFFVVAVPTKQPGSKPEDKTVSSTTPVLPYAAGAAEQSQRVRELLQRNAEEQRTRVDAINNGAIPPPPAASSVPQPDTEQLSRMIAQTQKAELESAVGEAPDTAAARRSAIFSRLANSGPVLLLFGLIGLLWAAFYYPAACAVAGYTQSFRAAVNPMVGLDTIRRLGADYAKLLLVCAIIGIIFCVVAAVVSAALSAFDLPGVGNLPGTIVESVFSFYLYIVFALVLGSLLYKGASRLELPGA